MSQKYIRAVVLLAFFAVSAAEASGSSMSLDEYRAAALRGNRSLQASRMEADAAASAKAAAFTGYFPKVSAFGVMLTNYGLSGGSMLFPGLEPEDYNYVLSGFTVQQTMFAGGRILNGNRLADAGKTAAREALRSKRRTVSLEAEKKYRCLLVLSGRRETLRAYGEMIDALYRQTEQAERQGIATKTDVLRVSLKKAEISEEEKNLEKNIILAGRDMLIFAGTDTEGSFSVRDDSEPVTEPVYSTAALKAKVYDRPEYRIYAARISAARLQREIKKGEFMPTVNVGIEFDRLDNTSSGSGNHGNMAFAALSVPVSGWWGGSHEIREYGLKEEAARENFAETSDYLLLDMENKLKNWEQSYRRYVVAGIGADEASANRREIEDGYKHGTEKLSDYLEAAALEFDGRNRLLEARAGFFVARADFMLTVGELDY